MADADAAATRKTVQDERARDLSIMLDFIAMHAAKENYLLDERYRALLGSDAREVAGLAQTLATKLSHLPEADRDDSGWRELRDQLSRLGA